MAQPTFIGWQPHEIQAYHDIPTEGGRMAFYQKKNNELAIRNGINNGSAPSNNPNDPLNQEPVATPSLASEQVQSTAPGITLSEGVNIASAVTQAARREKGSGKASTGKTDAFGSDISGNEAAAGNIASAVSASLPPTAKTELSSSGQAAYDTTWNVVRMLGPVGQVVKGVVDVGNAIGDPIKQSAEKTDDYGYLENKDKAVNTAHIGAMVDPLRWALGGFKGEKGYVKALEKEARKKTIRDLNALEKVKAVQAEAGANNGAYSLNYRSGMNENAIKSATARIKNPYNLSATGMKEGGEIKGKKTPPKKYTKGGQIVGPGTAKSDSIKTDLEPNSFVVPAENASIAKAVRRIHLGDSGDTALRTVASKSKTEKLKEGGENDGIPVQVSNGEHLFTPDEVNKLTGKGVDLNMLAPNARPENRLEIPMPVMAQDATNAVFQPKTARPANISQEQIKEAAALLLKQNKPLLDPDERALLESAGYTVPGYGSNNKSIAESIIQMGLQSGVPGNAFKGASALAGSKLLAGAKMSLNPAVEAKVLGLLHKAHKGYEATHITAGTKQVVTGKKKPPAKRTVNMLSKGGEVHPSNYLLGGGTPVNPQVHIDRITKVAKQYGITDPKELQALIAIARHETGNFKHMNEILSDKKGNNAGNYQSTEFTGRGYVQITHKENYEKMSKLLSQGNRQIDLVSNPSLASDPDLAAEILVLGLRDGVFTGKTLKEVAQGDSSGIYKAVNPGAQSDKLAQFESTYNDTRKKYKFEAPKTESIVSAQNAPRQLAGTAKPAKPVELPKPTLNEWEQKQLLKRQVFHIERLDKEIANLDNSIKAAQASKNGTPEEKAKRVDAIKQEQKRLTEMKSHVRDSRNWDIKKLTSEVYGENREAWFDDLSLDRKDNGTGFIDPTKSGYDDRALRSRGNAMGKKMDPAVTKSDLTEEQGKELAGHSNKSFNEAKSKKSVGLFDEGVGYDDDGTAVDSNGMTREGYKGNFEKTGNIWKNGKIVKTIGTKEDNKSNDRVPGSDPLENVTPAPSNKDIDNRALATINLAQAQQSIEVKDREVTPESPVASTTAPAKSYDFFDKAPTILAGLQFAQGIRQARGHKRPIDDIPLEMLQRYPDAVNAEIQAELDAMTGLDSATRSAANSEIERTRRTSTMEIDNSMGKSAVSQSLKQLANKDKYDATVKLAAVDAGIKAQKKGLAIAANQRTDNIAGGIAEYKRKLFDDKMSAFTQNQDAAASLINAGLSNYFTSIEAARIKAADKKAGIV